MKGIVADRWSAALLKWGPLIVVLMLIVFAASAVVVSPPLRRYTGPSQMIALASAVGLTLIWLVAWVRADKQKKISTGNLIFIWFLLSGIVSYVLREAKGVILKGQYGEETASTLLGFLLLLALAYLQEALRKRWQREKCQERGR